MRIDFGMPVKQQKCLPFLEHSILVSHRIPPTLYIIFTMSRKIFQQEI